MLTIFCYNGLSWQFKTIIKGGQHGEAEDITLRSICLRF